MKNIQKRIVMICHQLRNGLSANQLSWSSVVKMTVFLTDAAYLSAVRTAFTAILAENKPAMSLLEESDTYHCLDAQGDQFLFH